MGGAFLLTAWRLAPPAGELLRGTVLPALPAGSGLLVLGLVGIGLYYALVQLGNGLVATSRAEPWMGAWMPVAVLFVLGLGLFFRARSRSVLGLELERGPIGAQLA